MTEKRADLLGSVTVIHASAQDGRKFTAIPYYAWDHRKPGEMVVWIKQDGKSKSPNTDDPAWAGKLYQPLDPATLGPSTPPTLAGQITATASFCDRFGGTPAAMHDEILPKDSCDHDVPRFSWYDRLGTKEWAHYDFPSPQKVSAVAVYWFDDGKLKGHCRVPNSWQVLYKDGDQWKPVKAASSYGIEQDKLNCVTFEPVETKALRLDVQLNPPWSAGILEWQVE